MPRSLSLLILVIFCLCFYIPGLGQEIYLLRDTTITHRLDAYTEVFIDPTNNVSIDHVLKPEFQRQFQPSNDNLKFGYLKSSNMA